MKIEYLKPEMEIEKFAISDVITLSEGKAPGDDLDWGPLVPQE